MIIEWINYDAPQNGKPELFFPLAYTTLYIMLGRAMDHGGSADVYAKNVTTTSFIAFLGSSGTTEANLHANHTYYYMAIVI